MIEFFQKIASSFFPSPSPTPAPAAPDLGAPLAHARESYQNLQEIIRFTDLKTMALLFVILLMAGGTLLTPLFLAMAGQWTPLSFLPRDIPSRGLMGLCWFLSIAFGFLAFINALMSLIARTPNTRGPFLSSPLFKQMTALFCVYGEDQFAEARRCTEALKAGFSIEDALEEYRRQILVVGAILSNKIKYHRQAILCIALQATALITALMFIASAVASQL
ncbi:MAG: hypothetical protein SFY92_07630 [Verrucomicrobiae bacterium]|nr:hypothetical protein [Verrucomicrobiae bacterium]